MSKTFAYSVEEIVPPEYRFSRENVTARRIFKLPWANHRDFVEKMLGNAIGQVGSIIPDKLTGYANIEAVDAVVTDFMNDDPKSMTGTLSSSALPTIEGDCQVTVNYSTEDRTEDSSDEEQVADGAYFNPSNPGGDPILLEYEADESSEVMAIPGRYLKDANGNVVGKPDEYAGFVVLNILHRVTIYSVRDLPPARRALSGSVNGGQFTIPVVGVSIPGECGMYLGSTLQRRFTARDVNSNTEPAWNVTYTIAERSFRNGAFTWNHAFAGGRFRRVFLDGQPPYQLGDFNGLFFF
jgi:hypothetical protein